MDSASRPEVKYNNSWGDLAEWKLVTFYRSNRPTKNMYCKADYSGFTTCKWTTYAQARAYVHVKTWERPKRAARS